jgi:preprotein translocase subunit SecA
MRQVEREVVLKVLDQHWRDHLAAMDYLRQGIHLRGYAQKDYRYEYKRESFELFTAMLERVKFEAASLLAKVEIQIRSPEEIEREEMERRDRLMRALQAQHAQMEALSAPPAQEGEATFSPVGEAAGEAGTFTRTDRKVGRNEPCPCGSGKKYKHCHGAIEA